MNNQTPAQHLYEQTSQYKHWQFTAEKLMEKRLQVNTDGVARTLEALRLENELKQSESTDSSASPGSECVTWKEQLDYCRFYEGKIIDYCKFFGFDKTVQATAIVFFKRFYLNNTVMDYDPKIILMTCLFLSTKVENSLMPLDEFLSKVPKSPDASVMIHLEFVLSKGIQFEYSVHHPYWPLHGFFLDIQTFIQSSQPRGKHPDLIKRLYAVYNQATDLITSSLISDALFMYMPSQIALAAIQEMASHVPTIAPIISAFITDRFQNETPERVQGLIQLLQAIRVDLCNAKELTVNKATAAVVASKLRLYSNPEFDPTSKLFALRKQEEEQQNEAKRLKKADKARHNRDQLATIVN
ncbi:hypothetical protein BATDEDRAFT_88645 [Batrachochytrium dendrobatidis JAM81]|uniref:Cyclin-like domain-containing protein n=1 Tax=Batrachochytrium dendrobatidis (strain JAM81 / FGSC 10211) TaxID=684364 RepID=F4P2L2_BATDJ|nr:uncharacterized protein BATDEDRAFT_88645 [Batrachochytrium dendrobatidis JAM81]EGF80229.1 hypothetical protein BATDEDRAFT_88645 [Batrachochytrium dendrobatidis JAM81]|eukprot:XP_006679214.1 hypothetical protein BATDEDRAFT_88645 [Batrachochytrium dendrobatidis JAM81]